MGKLRIFRRVFGREATNSSRGLGRVIIEEQRSAVGRRSKDARIGPQDFATELFGLQIFGNVRAKRAERVRQGRSVKAGMKFLGDGATADHFAAFKDEWLEAALGKIESSDENIVPAANENHALSDRHG